MVEKVDADDDNPCFFLARGARREGRREKEGMKVWQNGFRSHTGRTNSEVTGLLWK